MTKFQTNYNREQFTEQREKFTKPSLTIPDQSFTIEEIYRRFAQGRPMNIERPAIYDGDVMLPQWHKLDLSERQELLRDIGTRVDALKHDYHTLKTQHDAKTKQTVQPKEQTTVPSTVPPQSE